MKIHRLHRCQQLNATLAEAWRFFSDPRNLAKITPPAMGFEILSDPGPDTFEGQIIVYRIRLALGLPCTWVTEIRHVHAPHQFVDEQRSGPYRFWHHRHQFVEKDGGVEMTDEVHYALWPLPGAGLLHRYYVRPQIERIFDYRTERIREKFGAD
ncbi:MAG: SRPBCC family protein [Verrucomicrobiae bacterium]|nr:SRPBCC family protein [Verrucomicrobiae bacterium]